MEDTMQTSDSTANVGRDYGDDGAGSLRGALDQVRERASDGWDWVRQNPWPALGALAGIGLLLAMRKRSNASHRLSHMNADHAVGHGRKHFGGTDDVAKGMSRSSY